ncbi:MAG: SUMF1/EgtB/PvdO family nonheme iron enzyme [Saprospiraceae bacterium]|nr:SUMF1/EgtB/PvdO family nonheme iron enzyme [Saprospiraceae bacterium]
MRSVNQIVLLIFIASIPQFCLRAQTGCEPASPIAVEATLLTEKSILAILEKDISGYTPTSTEADAEIKKWRRCEQEISTRVDQLNSEKKELGRQLIELQQFGDVAELRARVETLKKSRDAAMKQLGDNLATTQQLGLYVVVLTKEDINREQSALRGLAQSTLNERAVEDMGETFVQRLTTVASQEDVKDVIESFTRGECHPEQAEDKTSFDAGNRYFLYVARVSIKPLTSQLTPGGAGTATESMVFDLVNDTTWRKELIRNKISDKHIAYIDSFRIAHIQRIIDDNLKEDRRRRSIIEDGEKSLKKIDRDIQEAQADYDERCKSIRNICNNMGASFAENNPEQSIGFLRDNLVEQIRKKEQDILRAKEQQIFWEEETVPVNNSPTKDLTPNVISLAKKLENRYQSSEKIESYVKVDGLAVTDYKQVRQIQLNRRIQKVWIYPVGQKDGYRLLIGVRFEIYTGNAKTSEIVVVGDSDRDGVKDDIDKCPTEPGESRWAGCPDSDGDSVPNHLDECPFHEGTLPNGCPEVAPGFVYVQGGTFYMGDLFEDDPSDEYKPHLITVSDFWMSGTEVSYDEFDRFCKSTDRRKPRDEFGRATRPAAFVSWYDAVEFCNWLSMQHGLTPVYQIDKKNDDPGNRNEKGKRRKGDDPYKWTVKCIWEADGYRLPTEAEWEFAARERGDKKRFGNGQNEADPLVMNLKTCSASADYFICNNNVKHEGTRPVDFFKSNALRLHNMSGNVAEWCWDWYEPLYYSNIDYYSGGDRDPHGPREGTNRIAKGGDFENSPNFGRSAEHTSYPPATEEAYVGFRVVRAPKRKITPPGYKG